MLRDIEIHLLVLSGEFMEILEELVQNTVYDYIVMGMKGSRTLTSSWLGMEKAESVDNFWVGSHTNKVLEKIKIPIIVVPPFAKFRNLQQITLAIDTKKEYVSEVFAPLQTLADFFKSNVAIVTIRLREETKEEDKEEVQLKKIKKWIGNTIVCSLKVVIADTVQEGLQYYIAQKNNQDMLVMVTRKKDFFEKIFGLSATQQMVYSTDTPILILHNHQT
jgi:nucleotide-binding universal stress UspA family protein